MQGTLVATCGSIDFDSSSSRRTNLASRCATAASSARRQWAAHLMAAGEMMYDDGPTSCVNTGEGLGLSGKMSLR